MRTIDFSASYPRGARRDLRRRHPTKHPAALVTLLGGMVVSAMLYSKNFPGHFTIEASAGPTVRSIIVKGKIENPLSQAVQLNINRSSQRVPVSPNGEFQTVVPLMHGENLIVASNLGIGAVFLSPSNIIRLPSAIPKADIWATLTWSGPGDIDLHLVLPDGNECYYENCRGTNVGGAVLDFDNTVSDGPENIVVEKASPGKYRVQVVYYRGTVRNVPWRIDFSLKDGTENYEKSGVLKQENDKQDVLEFVWP